MVFLGFFIDFLRGNIIVNLFSRSTSPVTTGGLAPPDKAPKTSQSET